MEVRSLIHAETRYRIYAEKVQDLGQNKTRLTEINLVFTILIWWIFKETDNNWNSADADGGPRSRVRTAGHSAQPPIDVSGNLSAHVSA